ncbi:MAG: hypothetical protein RLY16_421 [Bacteroidota bacterium]|jgi:hypothetical protein
MKRKLLLLFFVVLAGVVNAQKGFSYLNVDGHIGYAQFLGSLKYKPMVKGISLSFPLGETARCRIGYSKLGYSNFTGLAYLSNSGYAASNVRTTMELINFDILYYIEEPIGTGLFSYVFSGGSYIHGSYIEYPKGGIPEGEELVTPNIANLRGFDLHVGIGSEYSFGRPRVFGEVYAGYIPWPLQNGATYTTRVKFGCSVGVRVSVFEDN